MTREEIIRMAREAGIWISSQYAEQQMERFAALVASASVRETSAEYRLGWNDGQIAEREACAKAVENYCGAWDDQGYALANTIRARGEASIRGQA